MLGQVGFESLCKFAPCQQDPTPAAFTFKADIRAKACDSPLIGTTRMLFTETQVVVEAEIGEHKKIR